MQRDVLVAQARTLSEWAEQFQNERAPGCNEVAFFLGRTSLAMLALANGEKVPEFEVPAKDVPMEEPPPG